MSEAQKADGPLAFDDAVGLLSVEPAAEPEEAAPAEVAEPEEPNEAGDQPAEDVTEPEEVAGDELQEPEPETAIEAPHFWSAERKADFAKLPPEIQAYVLEQDKGAQRTVSQKLEEAATARKEAEAKAKAFVQLTEQVTQVAAQAEEAFSDRWKGMTPDAWLKLSREDPARYTQLKAQHDADQAVLQQVRSAREATEQVAYDNWLKDQSERLKTLAPELADPVEGQAKMQAVATYLRSQGVEEQAFKHLGALEWSMADKARRWDEAQASLARRPAPPAQPARPAVKPTSAVPVKPNSALETANRRLGQTGDIDDAVAVLRARRNTG